MISEYLRDVVRRYCDRLAIVDGDQRLSYGQLWERVQAAREWLQSTLDPKPGDVIAVVARQLLAVVVACFFWRSPNWVVR